VYKGLKHFPVIEPCDSRYVRFEAYLIHWHHVSCLYWMCVLIVV